MKPCTVPSTSACQSVSLDESAPTPVAVNAIVINASAPRMMAAMRMVESRCCSGASLTGQEDTNALGYPEPVTRE